MADDLIEKIYYQSPIWLQNIFVSTQGWLFRYRRADERIIRAQFEFLLKSERWTAEQFREYQGEQLRRLLRLAFQHVPYYRDLQKKIGCAPEDFKSPEDLCILPVLEKSQIRGQEHLFLNETINPKKCNVGYTGGTTGTPLKLYDNSEGFSRRWGFVIRLRHWAGLNNPFYPRLAHFTGRKIISPDQVHNNHTSWRWNLPGNSLLFSSYHLTPENVPYYLEALQNYRPELIDGFPSIFSTIVRVSRRLRLQLPIPKAIIVTSETIFPEHRTEIEEAFNCRLYNQYAASEPSCFWCDCKFGVMHENPEYGISEIVSALGTPVQPGEVGDVLLTSFLNPVMILIRYKIGDRAVRGATERCLCGRDMPRIERIEGRFDDIFYIPERGYVGRLDAPLKGLHNIVESQVIQEDFGNIRVLIVPDSGYNPATAEHLVHALRYVVGKEVNIDVELVDHIPRLPNGKFIAQISKVKHLYPDQVNLYNNQLSEMI
jgi:phenylacetate-CoA ligase